MTSIKDAKALTISYLTPVSFASLNGSDKEADNISSIKKITVDAEEYPYVSSGICFVVAAPFLIEETAPSERAHPRTASWSRSALRTAWEET